MDNMWGRVNLYKAAVLKMTNKNIKKFSGSGFCFQWIHGDGG